jgi:hypothetical protein
LTIWRHDDQLKDDPADKATTFDKVRASEAKRMRQERTRKALETAIDVVQEVYSWWPGSIWVGALAESTDSAGAAGMPAAAAGVAGSALADLGVDMPGRVMTFPMRPGPLLPGGRPDNGLRSGVIRYG